MNQKLTFAGYVPPQHLSWPLRSTQPGRPSWLDAVSTGDSIGHCWRRNGECCVAVGPMTTVVIFHETFKYFSSAGMMAEAD